MNGNVGVWIDHRKAVIVSFKENVEEIHTVVSDVEKHVRYTGGVPEDQQEHRFTNHLKEYYDKVISFLHKSDSILILGPGEAKGEFEKRLIADSLGSQIVGIETEDKMTDHQIAAKVKEHFLNPVEKVQPGKKH